MDTKHSVLMLPWLAHGHISPFLELAKRLSRKNFHIYLCSTPISLKPFRENQSTNLYPNIEFIDIHLPSSPHLPSHYHTTKDLPPHLMPTLKTAFDESKPVFSQILKSLKPDILIYDFLQPWAPLAAREENIPAVLFLIVGAASCSFLKYWARVLETDQPYPFPELRFEKSQHRHITGFLDDISNGLTNGDRFKACIEKSTKFVLIKSSKEIEAKHIDYLSLLCNKEVVPTGLLVQESTNNNNDHRDIIEWLNTKDDFSGVFVSFGSEYFLSKEEIEDIAHGLELSQANFIWVIRFPEGQNRNLHEVLPRGFLDRIGNRGLVLQGWAPQARILGHSCVGAFVSHCGWNSILEGILFGVPIVAMPMQLDQPLNARLVGDIGVGIEIKREIGGRFRSDDVARVIKQVLDERSGKAVRGKVMELSRKMEEIGDGDVDVAMEKLAGLMTSY